MTPEGKVKSEARRVARECGVYTFPVNQQGIGRRGIPDDLIIVRGTVIFVEFKAHMNWETNNKSALRTLPTYLQILEMEHIREAGGITFVVDDVLLSYYCDWLRMITSETSAFVDCSNLRWDITTAEYDYYRDMNRETSEYQGLLNAMKFQQDRSAQTVLHSYLHKD